MHCPGRATIAPPYKMVGPDVFLDLRLSLYSNTYRPVY